MAYLEELLPEFRKGAKIRCSDWEKDKYIQKKGGLVATDNDFLCSLSVSDIFSNRWELHQDPEPDWQYIIDHKCLCFFWDSKECSTRISCLKNVRLYDNDTVQYIDTNDTYWLKCRPVRRDEVAFYEDKKDEQD
jgi:hypothetical protein